MTTGGQLLRGLGRYTTIISRLPGGHPHSMRKNPLKRSLLGLDCQSFLYTSLIRWQFPALGTALEGRLRLIWLLPRELELVMRGFAWKLMSPNLYWENI
ncbi:hypothetical protein LINPERHAP1_LOCUS30896 [Linum perenne]